MRKWNNRGEGYVEVAISVLLIAFVLVFAVSLASFVALNQNLKTLADGITDYAAAEGTRWRTISRIFASKPALTLLAPLTERMQTRMELCSSER